MQPHEHLVGPAEAEANISEAAAKEVLEQEKKNKRREAEEFPFETQEGEQRGGQ